MNMSLGGSLFGETKKRRTNVDMQLIRYNELNRTVSEEDIELVINSIKEDGLLHNLVVYKEELEDGKQYTLLSGEARLRAIKKLLDEGEYDEDTVQCVVLNKPENLWEEKRLLHGGNHQHDLTEEEKKQAVRDGLEYYEYLKEQGSAPTGLKRDFVGDYAGISGRQVQKYMTGHLSDEVIEANANGDVASESAGSTNTTEKSEEDIKKAIKSSYKQVLKALSVAEEIGISEYTSELESVLNKLKTSWEWL